MENIIIEDLDDESLIELLNLLQGLDDELKKEVENNE